MFLESFVSAQLLRSIGIDSEWRARMSLGPLPFLSPLSGWSQDGLSHRSVEVRDG